MARKSHPKAVPQGAAQAAPNAQAAAVPERAAETSDGGAETTVSVDAAGSGSPQAADGADSVSTSDATEAASSLQSDAASTLSGRDGQTDTASGGDSLAGGPGEDAVDMSTLSEAARAFERENPEPLVLSPEDRWFLDAAAEFPAADLLGSSHLPDQIDIGRVEPLALGDLVVMAQGCSGLSEEAWNDLAEDTREAALALMLEGMRAISLTQTKIEALLAPIDESLVLVAAKTRHGGDMTRGGVQWTRSFRAQAVTPEVAARLRKDPNLIVKDDD